LAGSFYDPKSFAFSRPTVGLGLTIWLLAAANLASVVDSLTRIGWGVLAVVGVRAAMIAINAAA
jgi:hypothetical protein